MIDVKKIVKGSQDRIWFVAHDGSVYTWTPSNQRGLSGDYVDFHIGFLKITVRGPWCSSPESLKQDTGENVA